MLLAVDLSTITDDASGLDGLTTRLGERPDVDRVLPPAVSDDEQTALVQVIPETGPQEPATTALVHDLRQGAVESDLAGVGADALVGGMVAAGIDYADAIGDALPWFIGAVLVLALVLLSAGFRSILVPVKAVLVNMLTVGSAYGIVVAVFQWGWLGLAEAGPIEPWVPMVLFAMPFGLSIDYEVFLISRVREHYLATRDNTTAIAQGFARSARLIFVAAAIMVCVFGAFALLADRELQMLGLGLAVAIAIDATLVRLVLVPAVLELGGHVNWWWPGSSRHAGTGPGVPTQASTPSSP